MLTTPSRWRLGTDGGLRRVLSMEVPIAGSAPVAGLDAEANATYMDFEAFYRAHADAVRRALAVTLGDAATANEAVDEAMTRALAHWSRVGRMASPAGWVYRVGLVSSILNRAGVTLRRRGIHPDDLAEVIHFYGQGWALARLAAKFDVSPSTVTNTLRRAGVPIRQQAFPSRIEWKRM
jgi:DNA-directed RNA polymerase specialized sigma24 family protein